MNERIKELLYKAGGEYGGEHPTTGQIVIYTDGVNCEKFAELIVRECAKIAEKEQAFNARYTDADKHPQVNIDQCILIEFGL